MILRFPYNSRWEPSGYREWVEWSSTQTFDLTTQYSHHFVEIQNKISNEFRVDLSQINNKNIWSKEGIISEIENLKLFRFCHHFSGQIESENKIVICLINPLDFAFSATAIGPFVESIVLRVSALVTLWNW